MTELETIILQNQEIIRFFAALKPTLQQSSENIIAWQENHQREDNERHKETNDNIKAIEEKINSFNKYYSSVAVVCTFIGMAVSYGLKLMGKL